MLEFYSANIVDPALKHVSAAHAQSSIVRRVHARVIASALAVTIVAGGCASIAPAPSEPPSAPPLPRNAEPPAPAVNLSGFPLPYRQGYADGCASLKGAERKDAARYAGDPNYRTGWQDGNALCRRK